MVKNLSLIHIVLTLIRLEKGEMLGWTKLRCLKAKLLEGTESKYWAGMYTGLANFWISSECYPSFSQLSATMCAQWYDIDVYLFFYLQNQDDRCCNVFLTIFWILSSIADDCSYCIRVPVWKSLSGNSPLLINIVPLTLHLSSQSPIYEKLDGPSFT